MNPRPFWDCGLCSFNLLFESNNFGLGAILLSCLVSKLQETPSPGLELMTNIQNFDLSEISSLSQGISTPHLVQIVLSGLKL
jgi:hypothetical protein